MDDGGIRHGAVPVSMTDRGRTPAQWRSTALVAMVLCLPGVYLLGRGLVTALPFVYGGSEEEAAQRALGLILLPVGCALLALLGIILAFAGGRPVGDVIVVAAVVTAFLGLGMSWSLFAYFSGVPLAAFAIGGTAAAVHEWWRSKRHPPLPAIALMAGGVLAMVTFVPFTMTDGPTSFDRGAEPLGPDMHLWGFILGSFYPFLVGAGLWHLRRCLAGERRAALWAFTIICVAFYLLIVMTVLRGSLGPPYDIVMLAPATLVATITTMRRGIIRGILAALSASYVAALAVGLLPVQVVEGIGIFWIFGVLAYAVPGALWAALGAAILTTARRPHD